MKKITKTRIYTCILLFFMITNLLPVDIIALQNNNAYALGNDDYFKSMIITKGGAIGVAGATQIVDLLSESSSDWSISTNADYYLNCSVTPTSEYQYIRIVIGSETEGKYSGNGVIYTNIPGGVWTKGEIGSDYLSELSLYTNYAEPTYGKDNTLKLTLQDGELIYKVKSEYFGKQIPLNVGFQIRDELFAGGDISDAIKVEIGTYSDNVFETAENGIYNVSLNMSEKNGLRSYFNVQTANSTLGSIGNQVALYAVYNSSNTNTSAILYDTIEFDMTYPQGAELEIGFSQYYASTPFYNKNDTGGVLNHGAAATNADGTQTVHYTIEHGYKTSEGYITLFMRLNFPNNSDFAVGDTYKLQVSNLSCTVVGKTVNISLPLPPKDAVAYKITAGNVDNTVVAAINRTEIYNNSIDGENNKYLVSLGAVNISNTSESSRSPYEKSYEAFFNTTNTAANITTISVPVGYDSDGNIYNPTILWAGIDADGNVKSGTLSGQKVNSGAKGKYILISAESLNIVTFTSVKSDIGYLNAGYQASSYASCVQPYYQCAGAWGYFTTNEAGLVVKNTYRVYNTDTSLQDKLNGYLTVESTATSSDNPIATFLYDSSSMKINNVIPNPTVTIEPGSTATITGAIYPYYSISSVCNATCIFDPIMYLTLPQGVAFDEASLKFWLVTGKNNIQVSYQIENVSYLNTTGDDVSIYRITFPEDILIGYMENNGKNDVTKLTYSITFKTSRSLPTRRYSLNELVCITAANQPIAKGGTSGSFVSIVADKYGLNGGKAMSGIFRDEDDIRGIAVQQLAEVNLYTATTVTRINSNELGEDIWNNYDDSDPNSIAILGSKSEGRLRLRISNTSDVANGKLQILLPIPKKGIDLGDAFMTAEQQFNMSMAYNSELSPTGFTVKYVSITGKDDVSSMPEYTAVSDENEANGFLITADSVTKGNHDLFFDFTIDDGHVGETDIWRPVYSYETSNDTRFNIGSYSACSVATSSISGVVFNDENRDGLMNAGEIGVPNVTVVIKDSKNRIVSTVTDENGAYSFLAVRDEELVMTFNIAASSNYRFNVQAVSLDGASCVNPSSNGLSAVKSLQSDSQSYIVNAAVSSFCTLNYNKNGGSGNLPSNGEYIINENAIVAVKSDNLIKKGYSFVEWNTKSDGTGTDYLAGQTIKMTNDTTLYAIWKIASYTVSFNYCGATDGITEGSRSVQYNNAYGVLPAPLKNGYTFAGWCSIINGSKLVISSTTKFTTGSDIVLYAQWTAKNGFTVNYETTSGTAIESRNISWDDTVLPEGTTTRTGYNFTGWRYDNITVTDASTFGELAETDTNTYINLVAQWKPKTGYTVNYDTGEGSYIASLTNVNWNQNSLLPANNPTRESYAFVGWKFEGDYVDNGQTYGSLADNDIDTSITIVAQWVETRNNKVIHYITGNGATTYSDKIISDASDDLLPSNDPIRSGYSFNGWYTEANSSGIYVTHSTTYGAIQADGDSISIYAGWNEKTYKIQYITGSSGAIDDKINVKYYDCGILPLTEPSRSGYSFAGWLYEGDMVTDETKVSDLLPQDNSNTIVLIASWIEKLYTINYNSQCSTTYSAKSGVRYSSTGFIPDTAPVRTGYTFDGWYYKDKAVTTATQLQSLIPNDIADDEITLLAKWTPKSGFIVNYNLNGGEQSVPAKNDVVWNSTNLLPAINITRTGYTLTGWICGRTNVTAATAYSDLTTIDTPSTAITLIAQWTDNCDYTVKYQTSGGTPALLQDKANVRWLQTNLLPDIIVRKPGYILSWKCGNQKVDSTTAYAMLAGDDSVVTVTLTAEWTPKSYSINYDSNGGINGLINNMSGITYNSDNLLNGIVNAPVRKGYILEGWYYGNTKVADDTNVLSLIPNDNITSITLIAKWTANNSYTVEYNTNGGNSIEQLTNVSWTQKNLLPLSEPTKVGYTFDGWKYDNTIINTETAYGDLAVNDTTMSVTFVAQWTENSSYTVKYELNGGTPATVLDKADVSWTQTNLLPVIDVVKPGYILSWKCNEHEVTASSTYASLAEDNDALMTVTITAEWTPIGYSVNYDTNGGNSIEALHSVSWTQKNLIPLSQPIKAGYTFGGWKFNDTTINTETAYGDLAVNDTTMAITLVAQWTEKNSYIVKYELNGGTPASIMDKEGVNWTQANLLPAIDVVKSGYMLSWKCNEHDVTASSTYATLAEDNDALMTVIITAEWKPIEYIVQFNSNSGVGNMNQQTFAYDNEAKLIANTFTRADYSFAGWNTSANGSGIAYTDEQLVNNLTDINQGIIYLYAQWTQNIHYNVSGNIKDEEGYNVSDAKVTIMQGLDEIASTKTDNSGNYRLTDIPAGTYNIIIDKLEQRITAILIITDRDIMNSNFSLVSEKKNSMLILAQETEADAVPNVVVGGLDTIADSQSENTTIKLTVTREAEKTDDSEQLSIRETASEYQIDLYLDTMLEKTVISSITGTTIENIGDRNDVILEILIPYDFTGKTDIVVWRYHGDSAAELTELTAKPVENYSDGTFYCDMTTGIIYVYTKKFSTYAIGFKVINNQYEPSYPATTPKVQKPCDPEISGSALLLQTDNHIKYISGYEDGSVKPDSNMTRGEAAMMFYRLLRNQNIDINASFKDVPDSLWCSTAVNTLATLGIIQGYGNELFGPEDKITREQFCSMVIKFTSIKNVEYTKTFTDVTSDRWSYNSIMTAASLGLINGYDNNTFKPEEYITRAQVVTIVNHLLGRSADIDYVDSHKDKLIQFIDLQNNQKWYYYDMVEATNAHDYEKESGSEQWALQN